MSKHTPGPWRQGKIASTVVCDTPIERGIGGSDDTEYYGGHLICESVSECNVELIADAPELLAALRELLDFSEPDKHRRYADRAIKARQRAAELLVKHEPKGDSQ